MADRLFNIVTQVITAGQTYAITHGLTSAGLPVAPDLTNVEIVAVTAAETVALGHKIVGATTGVVSVAFIGAANVGTAVIKPQYLHSIGRIV